jgi:hypothetical protein
MVGCRLADLNAVVVPFAREYRKFTLFFTAGPNNQNDGQFGTITPAADTAANQ